MGPFVNLQISCQPFTYYQKTSNLNFCQRKVAYSQNQKRPCTDKLGCKKTFLKLMLSENTHQRP